MRSNLTPSAPLIEARYPVALIDTLRLADGRSVMLRPVMPRDAVAEGEFISELSPLSRRLRFHGAVNRLPDEMLRAMTRIDHRHHVALIAQALGEDGLPHIVADARYVTEEHDDGHPAHTAEFAIAVADAWQGVGLGRTLMQRLAQQARGQGLKTLHGLVLNGNEPMLKLLAQLGAAATPDLEDGSAMRVVLPV
jgi:GNAT superfamily N-acetyltransferase